MNGEVYTKRSKTLTGDSIFKSIWTHIIDEFTWIYLDCLVLEGREVKTIKRKKKKSVFQELRMKLAAKHIFLLKRNKQSKLIIIIIMAVR